MQADFMELNVLVACEESQAVTTEMRNLGIKAYSCDLLPPSGWHPEWHIQTDLLTIINDGWDAIIAFPPCTYLTVSGNAWFNVDKYGQRAIKRMKKREEAIEFFMSIANADCDYIAIENPVGIMSTVWRKPDQIIQPYFFGDPYEKKTCLWLKGFPSLKPTNIVKPEQRKKFKSGKTMPSWFDKWSVKERSMMRSKTFPGIARAMAMQWGNFLLKIKGDHSL